MCIYFPNRTDLNYNSGEHIFPAGIGGISKLPKGYVSDEFNEGMSALELQFMRDGLISMPRHMLGPGKRGSLSDAKATKSKIFLLTSVEAPEQFALGYVTMGKVFEIPHVRLNIRTGELAFSITNNQVNGTQAINNFKEKCSNLNNPKLRTILDNQLPDDLVLLGIADGVEKNYNCFIAQHETNAFQINQEIIKKIGASLNVEGNPQISRYLPRVFGKANFKEDYFRIYGKIAFNFLALANGVDFVNQSAFDPVRDWIVNGGEYGYVSMASGEVDPLAKTGMPMPADAHVAYLAQNGSQLIAQIFLYNAFCVILLLATDLPKDNFTDAFICDWQNQREYRLAEYVTSLQQQT